MQSTQVSGLIPVIHLIHLVDLLGVTIATVGCMGNLGHNMVRPEKFFLTDGMSYRFYLLPPVHILK